MGVPGVESGQLGAAGAAAAGLLRQVGGAQEGAALVEDPLVVGLDAGEARVARAQELVEVAAAHRRLAADQREVFGGEGDGLERAEEFAGAGERGLVEPGAVGAAGDDRQFGEQAARVVDDLGADDALLGAGADQRRVVRDPAGAEGGEVDRKSTRLNSSHVKISYAVSCSTKKRQNTQ